MGSPSGIAAAHLPLGSSLLYSLEAAAQVDAVVGDYPPPVSVANAGRPSMSGPSTLLLSRSGEEMAQFGRIERLAELVSSWEAYGAKLKVMY